MRAFALVAQKGGVGKTTLAVNLAAAWGAAGRRVLLVDLDPQGNASRWAGVPPRPGLLAALTRNTSIASIASNGSIPGVAVVPADPALAAYDVTPGRDPLALWRQLEHLEADVVVVDCPPSLGLLTLNGLVAGRAVVPVEPSYLALEGVAALMTTREQLQARITPRLEAPALVLTRQRHTALAGEVEAQLRARFGAQVLQAKVPESVRATEAPAYHQSVLEYAPSSPVAAAFRAVARELLRKGRP